VLGLGTPLTVQRQFKYAEGQMMRVVAIIAISILSTGCITVTTPASYSSDIQEAAKNVTLYEKCHFPKKKYSVIEQVYSHSCDIQTAKQILTLEGAKVKADAIVNYDCSSIWADPVAKCWGSWQCRGDAVQFDK
jgi:hypothetical protein